MISIKNFLNESDPKITIFNDLIDVLNYEKIVLLSDTKIVINYFNKILTIKGNNLSILKLLDNEILVKGAFFNIEFR